MLEAQIIFAKQDSSTSFENRISKRSHRFHVLNHFFGLVQSFEKISSLESSLIFLATNSIHFCVQASFHPDIAVADKETSNQVDFFVFQFLVLVFIFSYDFI